MNHNWGYFTLLGLHKNLELQVKLKKEQNKIKNAMIKITEETKIKDIIPDDVELDCYYEHYHDNKIRGELIKGVFLGFKKKEVKDFNWYVKTYLDQIEFVIHDFEKFYLLHLQNGNYGKVSFEIKIGLLKFICDDLKILMEDMFLYTINWDIETYEGNRELKKICPKEFINSLFE